MLALQLPSWLALLLTAALSTAAAPATAQRGSSDVGIVVGAGIAASMSGAAASRPVGVVLFEQQAMHLRHLSVAFCCSSSPLLSLLREQASVRSLMQNFSVCYTLFYLLADLFVFAPTLPSCW